MAVTFVEVDRPTADRIERVAAPVRLPAATLLSTGGVISILEVVEKERVVRAVIIFSRS